MMRRLFLMLLPLVLAVAFASDAHANDHRTLYKTMRLNEIIEIMRQEGLAYGDDLGAEMLGGSGGPGWPKAVDRIYAIDRMESEFLGPFEDDLDAEHVGPLIDFFASERGQEILEFEISARRALLDEDVEETAREIWRDLEGEFDPRLELIERFVDANDLIEANVAGAMNSSLAFYEGLASGDALDGAWTMDRILSTVWEQEAEIRADTRAWIYPFLTLAFEPLPDDHVEAYIALSESDPGQALNAALFAAFDVLFVNISRDMGAAAAIYMRGEDI